MRREQNDIHKRMALEAKVDRPQMEAGEFAGYVETRLALAIHDLARYAIKRRIIAAFVSPSGVGKSMCLTAIAQEIPGSVLMTLRRNTAFPGAFLRELAHKLRVNYEGPGWMVQERVIDALREAPTLLIADELHKARTTTLDCIRECWDGARCPMLLSATPSFQVKLRGGRIGSESQDLHDQLFSRVSVFRDLTQLTNPQTGDPEPLVSVADVRKVFARGRLRLTGDGAMFLARLANTPGAGGLRSAFSLVQKVTDFWPGQEVSAYLLQQALVLQIGPQEAGFVVDTQPASKAAAG